MSKSFYIWFIKKFAQFVGIFLICDAVFHASGLRTLGLENHMSNSVIEFVNFFVYIWSSVAFLLGLLILKTASNIKKYLSVINLYSFFSLWHGFLLIILSFKHYEEIFPTASMYAWNSYYSLQLILEGCALIFFFLSFQYGKTKKFFDL